MAYTARVGLAGVALREHDPARAAELLRETLPRPGEDDPRGWEWHFLFRAVHPETRVAVWPGVGEVIAAGADRVVRLRPGDGARRFEVWDATTGTLLSARDAPADMAAAGDRPRFPTSADARRLVYRTAQGVVVWEPASRRGRLPVASARPPRL